MMKKTLAFLLVIVTLFCIASVNVFADEIIQNSDAVCAVKFYDAATNERIGEIGNLASIYVNASFDVVEQGEAKIYISSYDSNGLLLNVAVSGKISMTTGSTVEYTSRALWVSGAETVKVLIWNADTLKPVFNTTYVLSKTGVKEVKFEAKDITPVVDTEYALGDFFSEKQGLSNEIDAGSIKVEVSEGVSYTANSSDWTKGVVKATVPGEISITIYDNFLCEKTTATFRVVAPAVKFEAKEVTLVKDVATTIGDMFSAVEGVEIANVTVEVTGNASYVAGTTWTEGTITAKEAGEITVKIYDDKLCVPTEATFTVVAPEVKFEAKEVTLVKDVATTIGDMFSAVEGVEIANVTVEVTGNATYVAGASWAEGTITATDAGEITVKIYDDKLCVPTEATFTAVAPAVKFEAKEVTLVKDVATTIGDMFSAVEGVEIANVTVEVTGNATYVAGASWAEGTITATDAGEITVKIYDDKLCVPTEATFTAVAPSVKFESKFKNDYLYKVGNKNAVALGSLFSANADVNLNEISVNFESVDGNIAVSGSYDPESDANKKITDWSKRTVNFAGTGVVKVTITDGPLTIPTEIILEVVDAKNITSNAGATTENVVLLNDISGGGFSVSNGYTFFGNGFKVTCSGDGSYSSKLLTQGYINILSGGILEDTQIICDIFPKSYMYTSEMEANGSDRYPYARSAIVIEGDSKISGCYVYGARTNIYVKAGNVTIEDTVTENGSLANIHLDKSNDSYTVTFDNLTTIQKKTTSKYDESAIVLGMGVIVGSNESLSNPTIKLLGDLNQYNWVCDEDKNISNSYAENIIGSALSNTNYQHTINGKTYVNLGIVFLNSLGANIIDERNSDDEVYYKDDVQMRVMGQTITGQAYSVKAGSGTTAEAGFDAVTDGVSPYVPEKAALYKPQFVLNNTTLGNLYVKETEGCDNFCYVDGKTVKVMFVTGDSYVLDLASIISLEKYSNQNLGLVITVRDADGNIVTTDNNKITLDSQKDYTVTYAVTDEIFFDKDGNPVSGNIVYSWDITLAVSTKDVSVPDAEIEFDKTKQRTYNDETKLVGTGDYVQMVQFLDGLRIYDYIGQERYLRFNGDTDFNKIAKVSLGEAWLSGSSYYHTVTIELVDGGILYVDVKVSSGQGGSSTYNGSIFVGDLDGDGNKNLVFANNGKTAQVAQTWIMPRYEFKGNNGVSVKTSLNPFGSKDNYEDDISKPSATFSTTIKATVNFDANGGSCVQALAYSTSVSTAVKLPLAKRSGYAFVGWYTAQTNGTRAGGAGDSYTPSGNITLYAVWGKPSTVTYNANGGTCSVASDLFTGTELTLPAPTRDGYWFTGWYDAAEGGTRKGGAGDKIIPSEDTTLYAQWSVAYKVTYDANGGTCSPASQTYMGTALVHPMPAKDGGAFEGWYTAAEGGTKVGDAGASYTPTAHITLYAHWSNSITVSFNANGGSCSVASQTYVGAALTYPTPTRKGYVFTGWYDAASGGTKVGDAGASYTPSSDITLYAQWRGAVVTYNANGGSCSTSSQTYSGTALTLPTPDDRSNYTFNGWYTASSGGSKVGNAGASYTPEKDITLYAQWSKNSCVTGDTLVNMADGSMKRIDEITYDDTLLSWNFFEGKYEAVPASVIFYHGDEEYRVVNLRFSDGTKVKMISDHGFFSVEDNDFVNIDEGNIENYIGKEFIKVSDGKNIAVKLEGYDITYEYTGMYSIQTAMYINFLVEDMLSITRPPMEGWFDYFEIGDDMKYDEAKMKADIEKYGLFEYEDFAEFVTYEQFMAFNGPYLKVLVGRGVLTVEEIFDLIDMYVAPLQNK